MTTLLRALIAAAACALLFADVARADESSKAHPPQIVAVLEFDNQAVSGEAIDRVYFSDKVRGELKRRRPEPFGKFFSFRAG